MDRQTLSRESKNRGLFEYWVERKEIEAPPRGGGLKPIPFCWRWSDVHPLLMEAAKTVPIEEAHRRALLLGNPGMDPRPFMTPTLYGGISLYNPGEVASVHRHIASASRFALKGDGGFTTVEGEKCKMSRGDLILTPNGAWHDHGNDGTEPLIWVDLLDIPMSESFGAGGFFDFDYSEPSPRGGSREYIKREVQTVTAAADYSTMVYGTGGILPKFVSHKRGRGFGSPQFIYRWSDTFRVLTRLRDCAGDPRDGIVVEYVDPTTGKSALPTLSFSAQLLRPGTRLQWQRKTASTVFCVLQGHGRTELDGESIEWAENDVFVVPSWYWYRNVNLAKTEDLVLYSVSDSVALAKLGFLRSQARSDDGAIADLIFDSEGMKA